MVRRVHIWLINKLVSVTKSIIFSKMNNKNFVSPSTNSQQDFCLCKRARFNPPGTSTID